MPAANSAQINCWAEKGKVRFKIQRKFPTLNGIFIDTGNTRKRTSAMFGNRKLAPFMLLIFMAFYTANANEIPDSATTSNPLMANPNSTATVPSTTSGPFDCRNLGQECLHDGICAADGSHCDCSSTSQWFGLQCQLRRCVQRHNPCQNGAECEKTDQSFKCHCPIGFAGAFCEQRIPTICEGLENPCGLHGTCHTANLQQYQCQCHPGWTGPNCTLIDNCQGNGCLNGHCVNSANGHHCECRSGWGGEYCQLDVDECRIEAGPEGICQHGGNCQNLIGSFYCQCPAGFVGQFCERPNGRDQCQESTCLNGGQCNVEISATTANWALDVKQFDWLWECQCPFGFEGPRCEQIIDDCALGRMTCVNGGKCVRPWLEEQFDGGNGNGTAMIERIWHPAVCKCPAGYTGEFCEQDVNECEMYGDWNTGPCQNGATCMNRHGSYVCLCVGGFDGKYCEHNIDDCGENICYSGSTCLDGIARYNCLCAPDRVGTYCEFPNPCFNSPCANNGQCFADQETGHYMCQCQDGWRGRHCEEDIDECAQPSTNRCFNGKCLNTQGGFQCECEVGYMDKYCMTLVKYCEPNPCQNGATCLNDLGRYDCICLPGYSGKNCEVRAYQELNQCFLDCQNGGICRDSSAQQCECPPPYAGILCEIEKPDPCEQSQCAHGSVCGPNNDYISYTCQCPAYLGGQLCERQLVPCEEGGYNPCVHGQCQKGFNKDDFTCSCIGGWTGQLCDRPMDEEEEEEKKNGHPGDKSSNGKMPICPLARDPCLNGGQCLGVLQSRMGAHDSSSASSLSSSFFECICPRGFAGTLCEEKLEERCGRGCRNGGKCIQKESQWVCQCSAGFEGSECENEKNACLNVNCQHKGKCVNLGGTDYRCDCAPGWTGDKCEKNVDDCENIICLHGGKCQDRVNNYRCNCARGYFGTHCEIQMPVDKYNETDLLDMDNCRRQGCQAKATNGKCDPECNHYACKFDGGDCSTKQADPFERCPQPSYCSHVFADNKCDEICNNELCLFDGFDCLPRPLAKCPRLEECAQRYANGQCDEQCNIAACGWDGGDCDREAEPDPSEKPQILPGELMLVLAVQPEKLFPNLLREFLLSLSAHLRASLALSMDKDGQPRLFEWTSDDGIGERVKIPENLNVTTMFIVHYGEEEGESANGEDGKANRRRKRATKEEEEENEVKGVAVFLRVDVTMCNLLEQKPNNNQNHLIAMNFTASSAHPHPQHRRPLLGVHSPCFSDLFNVAAYVGAASAKKALPDIGVPIIQSEARIPTKETGLNVFWLSLAFGLLCFVIASGGMVVVMKRQRPNRTTKRCAKTWFPPLQDSSSSKYCGSTSTLANHHSQLPQQNHQQFCSNGGATFWQHFPVTNSGSCASNASQIPLMSHSASMASLSSLAATTTQQPQSTASNFYGNVASNPASVAQLTFYQQQQLQLQQFYNHHRSQHQQHHQQSSAPSIAAPLGHHQHHYYGPQQPFVDQQQQQQHFLSASATVGAAQYGHVNPLANNSGPNQSQYCPNNNNVGMAANGHHPLHPNTATMTTSTTMPPPASCSRSSSSGIGGSSTEHSPLAGEHHPIHPLHNSTTHQLGMEEKVPSTTMAMIMNAEEERVKQRLLTELREFAMRRQDGLINCQTKLEPWMVNCTHERHRTLLHLLFHNRHLMEDEQVLLANVDLLFKAAVDVDAQDRDGSTALSLAVRNRKYLTVQKLVEYGADVNLEDADYKTPIYHACVILPSSKDPDADEQIKIVEFLLTQKDIHLDTLTKSGESPLMRCALIRHEKTLKIAEMLLERVEQPERMDFVNQTGETTMRTALHLAASVNNEQMIKFLVKNGANKECMDKEGKTPLFVATEQAQHKAVEALLQLGADRNKTDINETKILELASQPGYEAILSLFMQYPDHPQHHHAHHYSHHRQNFQQQRQQQQQNEATTSGNSQAGNNSAKVSPASEIGTGKRQKGALKRAAPSSIAASSNITAVPPAGDEKLEFATSSAAKKAANTNNFYGNAASNPYAIAQMPFHQQLPLQQFYNHQRNQQQQHNQQSSAPSIALPLGHHQHHYYGTQQPFVDQHHISQVDEISENELHSTLPNALKSDEISVYLNTSGVPLPQQQLVWNGTVLPIPEQSSPEN